MNRRSFLKAPFGLFAVAQVQPEPAFEVLGHHRFRGRPKHFVHLDEYAYFKGQRAVYRHAYNQNPIVSRAISLHAEFPISSLT